jgi:1-deoxy-D-xylulose-5-phosphate reductoisomerase
MSTRVILIGATGSIGRQAREAIAAFPGEFEIVGMSAHRDEAGLLAAAAPWPRARLALSGANPRDGRIAWKGSAGLLELVQETTADIVVNGASGAAGLAPSLAALDSGKRLALANKESVVMGWRLLEASAARSAMPILPVDSEHASLFQLLNRLDRSDLEEAYITASGGAFRSRPLAELSGVTPDEAATHPNWSMGRKITIDSATMANKGLEIIEASRLFSIPPARLKVLIHPGSMVHALVRTKDGSFLLNASSPDMRLPILNALSWPEVLPSSFGRLELAATSLSFEEPDPLRYPLLGLAYAALEAGEGATIAYNAADEVAVAAFEAGAVAFTDIAGIVAGCLDRPWPALVSSLAEVMELDAEARDVARRITKES